MFDAGAPNPLYHYDPLSDGSRPYEPLMGNPVLSDGEYFFLSHEDDPTTAGFYFPEFKWEG